MKQFLVRGGAAALVAAAVFTTACSNDPMSPKAPSTARTPAAAAPHSYVGTAVSGSVGGSIGAGTGGATTNSGYVVSWGKDGQTPQQTAGVQQAPSTKH